jgi:hypothetical protein
MLTHMYTQNLQVEEEKQQDGTQIPTLHTVVPGTLGLPMASAEVRFFIGGILSCLQNHMMIGVYGSQAFRGVVGRMWCRALICVCRYTHTHAHTHTHTRTHTHTHTQ